MGWAGRSTEPSAHRADERLEPYAACVGVAFGAARAEIEARLGHAEHASYPNAYGDVELAFAGMLLEISVDLEERVSAVRVRGRPCVLFEMDLHRLGWDALVARVMARDAVAAIDADGRGITSLGLGFVARRGESGDVREIFAFRRGYFERPRLDLFDYAEYRVHRVISRRRA